MRMRRTFGGNGSFQRKSCDAVQPDCPRLLSESDKWLSPVYTGV